LYEETWLSLYARDKAGAESNLLTDRSNVMNGKIGVVLLSGLLFACAQSPPPDTAAAPPPPPPAAAPAPAPVAAAPPANRRVSIRAVRCARLLELPEDDRAAASLFYIGYQASRLGARTINVGRIPDAEARALSYCEASPNRSVADAFRQAYVRTLR
jgi:HdeA/HdeB family